MDLIWQTILLFQYLFMIYLHMHFYFYREKKDVRSIAALGVVYVVKTSWLEDCDREKKQIPVLRRHIAYDLVLPKGVLS
jgi:hypothetical protein